MLKLIQHFQHLIIALNCPFVFISLGDAGFKDACQLLDPPCNHLIIKYVNHVVKKKPQTPVTWKYDSRVLVLFGGCANERLRKEVSW